MVQLIYFSVSVSRIAVVPEEYSGISEAMFAQSASCNRDTTESAENVICTRPFPPSSEDAATMVGVSESSRNRTSV